jgi:hypothetical protein
MDFWHRSARTSRREKVRTEIIINTKKNKIIDDIWAKQLDWYAQL